MGIDINKSDSEGGTPLYSAACKEDVEVVKILLKYEGIDVNQQSKRGFSPLMVVCINHGNIAIVGILLACRDIDVNLETLEGETALDIAQTRNHTEVIEVITKHI